MTEKATTPPPTTDTATGSSSPATPAAKRTRMTSPETTAKNELSQAAATEQSENTEASVLVEADNHELPDEEDDLEADDVYSDSGFGTDSSDTTSISSSVFKGIVENGRRYQVVREGEYWGPSDEKQFESLAAGHIAYTLLDANQKNPLFRSPLPDTAQNILDIGTGTGEWCRQVADLYPSTFVQGVDLTPPPDPFVPPNCKFEVDDVLKPWLFKHPFDLIHMRDMMGSFTNEQWRLVYKQAYNNLKPGGWFEEAVTSVHWSCDDGSIKPDSTLNKWGDLCTAAFNRMGKNINTFDTIKTSIEAAGFVNVKEKLYKAPIGDWAKNPVLKEVGRYHKRQFMEGMEGFLMFTMTKFGEPEPWSPEEVHVLLAKMRKEIEDPKLHGYFYKRRVWGQKPLNSGSETKKPAPETETVAESSP